MALVKADLAFLQPVIDYYKIGGFEGMHLPIRVVNALDSLSWYGNVKPTEYERARMGGEIKTRKKRVYKRRDTKE